MIVELRGVHQTYRASTQRVHALEGIDLEVPHGRYALLTGPSGSGKSTLLHLAGLLADPTAGEVRFEGRPVAGLSPARRADLRLRRIGFVFQHYYLVPDLTAAENVALPAMAAGAPQEAARRRAADLLARVGIAEAADRLPRELSGGEQQRIGVARALVNEPSLILADEPTGNLDPGSADAVAALLAEAHESGVAILLATHDPAPFPEAEATYRLAAGRLAATGAARP